MNLIQKTRVWLLFLATCFGIVDNSILRTELQNIKDKSNRVNKQLGDCISRGEHI